MSERDRQNSDVCAKFLCTSVGTDPSDSSGEDGQLAHKKKYAHQKSLQSVRKIHKNDGQNK